MTIVMLEAFRNLFRTKSFKIVEKKTDFCSDIFIEKAGNKYNIVLQFSGIIGVENDIAVLRFIDQDTGQNAHDDQLYTGEESYSATFKANIDVRELKIYFLSEDGDIVATEYVELKRGYY